MKQDVLLVQAMGPDRRGLIADIASTVTSLRGNIIHVDHRVVWGALTITMVIEDPDGGRRLEPMSRVLRERLEGLGLTPQVVRMSGEPLPPARDVQAITILGADKLGVMHAIAAAVADHRVPILAVSQVASGEVMAFELLVDVAGADVERLRRDLKETCEAIGVDVIVQPHSVRRARKRLVVFDMDSTLIEGEVINELAREAGVAAEIEQLTERAMAGELDFETALRQRVLMLKGLPVSVLERIAAEMRVTAGAAELIRALKEMGFKVALISGGFTFFTHRLQEQLGLDHAFGNELEIRDGVLTGNVIGPLVTAERKAEILKELAAREGMAPDDVVAIGDGANDQIMLRNAGLGIAFNAKYVLRKVADGTLTRENIKGLLYCLGATPQDVAKL